MKSQHSVTLILLYLVQISSIWNHANGLCCWSPLRWFTALETLFPFCQELKIINTWTPQMARGCGKCKDRTMGGGIQKRVSELKSTVISLKPAYFQEELGMGGFSWPGRLVFLPLVSLRCCICHYDLQAWFSFQFLNPGLSPSMVLINGIHLAKSLLPATCRKT